VLNFGGSPRDLLGAEFNRGTIAIIFGDVSEDARLISTRN
jgi:hypothetical protein